SPKPTKLSQYDFTEANNQFALDLYLKLSNNKGNIFFSPYSISSALAMVYEGAKNETAEEIKNVFHFPDNKTILRNSFEELYLEINNDSDKKYELHTANTLWIQNDFKILEEYISVIKRYYHGEARNLNFKSDPEGSRKIINEWVYEQTNHTIEELIPPSSIDESTRLVITNAIYFNGKWASSFDKSNTRLDDFWIGPNRSIKVPMMRQTNYFNYAEFKNMQVLEMPYAGNKLSMIILLPKGRNESSLKDVEKSLTMNKIKTIRTNLWKQKVEVIIPKLKFVKDYGLKKTFFEMGISKAFSPFFADFSGITGDRSLYISKILHKAFIDVNEEGTEASAATAVILPVLIGPGKISMPPPILFKADHPFVFIIQDKTSGAILFIGRVSNPTEGYD
ncbi:MAG: serpin family protein, partial [Archaeoglobaceae archaeon]|nr:serpin family protein [Archaeoglobaceae archaeon]